MSIDAAVFVALWMIFVTAVVAAFALIIVHSDRKRIERRRQREHPAE
jgi:hypothetical protein